MFNVSQIFLELILQVGLQRVKALLKLAKSLLLLKCLVAVGIQVGSQMIEVLHLLLPHDELHLVKDGIVLLLKQNLLLGKLVLLFNQAFVLLLDLAHQIIHKVAQLNMHSLLLGFWVLIQVALLIQCQLSDKLKFLLDCCVIKYV